jgi:hypothetical protein
MKKFLLLSIVLLLFSLQGKSLATLQPANPGPAGANVNIPGTPSGSWGSKTIYTLPLAQGFNSTTLPVDWLTQLVTATGEKISFVVSASYQTATPEEGTDFVMFNSFSSTGGGTGAEERLISPGIVTTGTASVNAEFYWFESGNTTYTDITEGVQVEWSSNGTTWTNSTFYPRYVSTAPTTGNWVKKVITLPAGAGGIPSLYISFKFHSAYGYNCYLDNVLIRATPTCIDPTLVTTSAVTGTTATVSWTAPTPAPANGYDIYYSTSATAPIAGTTPTASVAAGVVTYNMTGLTPSTTYYVWVRGVCSVSDKSMWIGAPAFTTACGVIGTFPWTENFDAMTTIGTSIFPNCWLATTASGTPWSTGNAASVTYNDPCSAPNYALVYYSPYGTGNDKFLITPGFTLTAGTSYDFKFSWVGDGYAGWTGDVMVNSTQTGTGATALGASFVVAATTTTNVCAQVTRSYIPATTGSYYFMVRVNNTVAPYYLGFDNFSLDLTPSCVAPTALVMSAITSTSATVGWTPPPSAPANGYDIYYSLSSTAPTAGTTPSGSVAAGVTTYNLTGLSASSTYYVWVRSVCSVSDKSAWAGSVSFNTLCGSVAIPWAENFDAMTTIGNNILPNCWKAESPTGTPWTTANAATITYNDPCSPPNYIYVNWSPYGAGIYKFLITPGFSLNAGTAYTFSFNWVGDGTAGWAGDVQVNTTQTGVGATTVGTPFVDAATTTTSTCTPYTTTYTPATSGIFYFMVRANNTTTVPWDLGFDDFSLTGPPCLIPTALTATNITNSSADLGWTSAGTAWEYQYGLTGYTPTATGNATATNPTHVTGLIGGTNYDFYVRTNCSGSFSAWAGPMTFSTPAAPATVVTLAATAVGPAGATLNGTVNANGASTAVSFDYGVSVAYGLNVPGVPATVTGSTTTPSSAVLTGLLPNTLYHFRIKGISSQGTVFGNDMTFTTGASAPIVVTTAATLVNQTSAQLNATVNANNASTAVTFQYGLTVAYGTTVPGVPTPMLGNTAVATLANITGLTPSTLYHFRCVGVNSGGTTNGNDLTFTTPAIAAPTVTTDPATNTNLTIGTLNGTAIANGASTVVSFEYGLTVAYGSTAAGVPSPVIGNAPTTFSANLTGLTSYQTYHYRAKAVNSVGTIYGGDQSFQTICPTAGPAGPITGPVLVCQGGSGYVYTVTIPSATGYVWTLPIGATITSGANTNSITVSYAYNAMPGNLFVYGTAPCGNGAPSQLAISVNPPATPSITGPAAACVNSTGNVYTTQTGMTAYTWTVPAGGTITAGAGTSSITVTWTTVGAKTVTVNYNNASGCSGLAPATYNVTVNPLPVPALNGPSPACTNYPVVYSSDAGMTGYVWTVSAGGTINSGQGTSAINVTWTTTGAKTVTVNYANATGCTAITPTLLNVTVNTGAAPTITGPTSVCVNSGYITYTTQAGMTGYVWSVSPGGVINFGSGTNSIMVTWITAGAQWVGISYSNANGCAPASPIQLNVTVNPLPGDAGTITGPVNVCAGATGIAYSVGTILNASSYVWTLPGGATIASGAGTNSITVNYAADATPGNITVYGNNTCGNGTVSPALTIALSPLPAAAGTIDGVAAVCIPSTGVAYSVGAITGATGYNWVVPAGATIATGTNTNNITVDFSASAVAGAITVTGTNTCGNGPASPNFGITVTPVPPTPTVSYNGVILTSSAATGNQWYKDGTAIPGETNPTYVPTVDGEYWVVVTVYGCSSESDHISVVVGIDEQRNSGFSLYPIPNDGRFTISIVSPSQETYSISVFNNLGMKIYEAQDIVVNGTLTKVIDVRPVAQGIYSVVLQNGKSRVEKKILINK